MVLSRRKRETASRTRVPREKSQGAKASRVVKGENLRLSASGLLLEQEQVRASLKTGENKEIHRGRELCFPVVVTQSYLNRI